MKKLIVFILLGWFFIHQSTNATPAVVMGPFDTKEECKSLAWELTEVNRFSKPITVTRCWHSQQPEVRTQILPKG